MHTGNVGGLKYADLLGPQEAKFKFLYSYSAKTTYLSAFALRKVFFFLNICNMHGMMATVEFTHHS